MQPVDQLRSTGRQLREQRLQVADDRWQGKGKKQGSGGGQAEQQEKNRQPTAGMPAADMQVHNAPDHRCEDHREQGAYVEQHKDFPHQVSDSQHQGNGKREDDIAADGAGSHRLGLYRDGFCGRLGDCHA